MDDAISVLADNPDVAQTIFGGAETAGDNDALARAYDLKGTTEQIAYFENGAEWGEANEYVNALEKYETVNENAASLGQSVEEFCEEDPELCVGIG
jgi:hypothetical protein